eukprot:gene876-629_t
MHATKILAGFSNLVPVNCVMIRDGAYKEVPASKLVVGRNRVPADIRVAFSTGMKIDKSMLTGETEPTNGVGFVIATGEDNQLAKIVLRATGARALISLQIKGNHLVSIIALFAFISSVVVTLECGASTWAWSRTAS